MDPISHLSEQHDLSINSIAKSNFIYNHQVPLALKIISTHIPIALVTKEINQVRSDSLLPPFSPSTGMEPQTDFS